MSDILLQYTSDQINETCRRTLNSNVLASGLESPYTFPESGNMPVDTNNIVPITATILQDNGFSLFDFGGGDIAYQFQGTNAGWYRLSISASITTSGNNVVTEFGLLTNNAVKPGCSVQRKVGTGTDIGAFPICSLVYLEPLDRLDFFARADVATNVTFTRFGFLLTEVN